MTHRLYSEGHPTPTHRAGLQMAARSSNGHRSIESTVHKADNTLFGTWVGGGGGEHGERGVVAVVAMVTRVSASLVNTDGWLLA